MENIIRKGIAFDKKQLKEFDAASTKKGYKNRSDAIRDLIRKSLVDEKRENPESAMMGTLTLVYDHHEHNVQHNLTHIQHHHPGLIRSTLHVHMNESKCMEVLVLEGKVKNITGLADEILSSQGVLHGKLVLTG
ncbi:nickel-responsive transcriptional regulator NikR [Candidatus Woesearchaeota archaeon]|nr:nickel-responsive transcriptional regulator NikR [Candidatus Woesearchaeota archaeon]